jgi:plasmid stabilization system protein ParE
VPPVGFSPVALDDLNRIVNWLASFNTTAALHFLDRYEATLAKLTDNPSIGHRHNQIKRKNTFAIAAGDYLLVFELVDGSARVLRIVHGESDIRRLGL